MISFLDALEIEISCINCGLKFKTSIGQIDDTRECDCPDCSTTFKLKGDGLNKARQGACQLEREIKQLNQQLKLLIQNPGRKIH